MWCQRQNKGSVFPPNAPQAKRSEKSALYKFRRVLTISLDATKEYDTLYQKELST